MARIRTVKPEFWEDDTLGTLSRDARLLFIATFNIADDEGLLRWTPDFIKAKTFMYDDDLGMDAVEALMSELVAAGLVFAYRGGVAQQRLAYVLNFRKHQKINRPQPSKLPPPSLQNPAIRAMYGRRDNWTCHLCGGPINNPPKVVDDNNLSIDHLTPRSKGGSDYPSNLAASHQTCNKRRHTSPLDIDVSDSLNDSLSHSVNGAATIDGSLTSGRGGGREGRGREGTREAPSSRCAQHVDNPHPPPCGQCKEARIARERWDADETNRAREAMLATRGCKLCDAEGWRLTPGSRIPLSPYEKCDHRPLRSVS